MSATLETKAPQQDGSAAAASPARWKPEGFPWLELTSAMLTAALVGGMFMVGTARAKSNSADTSRDPRKGTVRVVANEGLFKRCDGDTLIYWIESAGSGGMERSTTPASAGSGTPRA